MSIISLQLTTEGLLKCVAGDAVAVPNALLLTGKGASLGTLQLSSVVEAVEKR